MLFFGEWTGPFPAADLSCWLLYSDLEYPMMLLTTVDPADNIVWSHTCISCKFYFMFGQDTYNDNPNEPFSGEDKDNDDDDFFPGVSSQWSE